VLVPVGVDVVQFGGGEDVDAADNESSLGNSFVRNPVVFDVDQQSLDWHGQFGIEVVSSIVVLDSGLGFSADGGPGGVEHHLDNLDRSSGRVAVVRGPVVGENKFVKGVGFP